MRKPHLLGTLLLVLAALLAGCGSGAGTGPDHPQPGQLKVVVAFYPFQYAAERVGGSSVHITNLTQPGSEPHDLELTPRQVASLGDADVVIYQRGFQPAVDKAVETSRPKRVLDLATVLSLAQESGANDPHTWLDPTNMARISAAIGQEFAAAKPDRAADFRQNSTAVEGELTALDQAYRTGLAQCRRKEFITSHAAFGYLANRYGLTQVGIRGISAEEEPSPARIATVQHEAKKYGVTTIFYETLVSPDVAKAIAGDLGLKVDVLDPLEGLTKDSRGSNYIEVMKSNLDSLKAANECN